MCFSWIPSLKLTWPLKNDGCKTTFLLETTIFRGETNFGRICFFDIDDISIVMNAMDASSSSKESLTYYKCVDVAHL